MAEPMGATRTSEERRRDRAEAIERFVRDYAPCENYNLLRDVGDDLPAERGRRRSATTEIYTALKELRYAFKVFAPYEHIPKVSIFGSARTPEDHPQYLEAKKFAEMIGGAGWMVITGAGGGIMRAGHHGATREASFGVPISLPFEQLTNDVIADDPKLVNFKYFFTRKLIFVKEAAALVLFPGGFGTQDEGFEAITLVQTAKTAPIPIILCEEPGGTYWKHWRTYVQRELLGNAMIDPTDMDLFHVTDRAEDALATILKFYRRYHSLRYVWDRLVIRLNSPVCRSVIGVE